MLILKGKSYLILKIVRSNKESNNPLGFSRRDSPSSLICVSPSRGAAEPSNLQNFQNLVFGGRYAKLTHIVGKTQRAEVPRGLPIQLVVYIAIGYRE